jgi:ligand-binding SRPBCC domain-containing protein
MKMHRITTEQFLPIPLEKAWDFFSKPENLDELTPQDISFEILSSAEERTYSGQIIRYRIRPILNIPTSWVTEITHCVENQYFIDEQRFGPYKFWHHQHRFKSVDGGVVMSDVLHYALPFGFLGEFMGKLFIHKKVNEIFTYREGKLNQLFSIPQKKESVL